MPVVITTIQKLAGESKESKPIPTHVGSTFYEFDTGAKFIYDGNNWVEDLSLIYAISHAIE